MLVDIRVVHAISGMSMRLHAQDGIMSELRLEAVVVNVLAAAVGIVAGGALLGILVDRHLAGCV